MDAGRYKTILEQGGSATLQDEVQQFTPEFLGAKLSNLPPASFQVSPLRTFIISVLTMHMNKHAVALWMEDSKQKRSMRTAPCGPCVRLNAKCQTMPEQLGARCDRCARGKNRCSLVDEFHAWLISKALKVDYSAGVKLRKWVCCSATVAYQAVIFTPRSQHHRLTDTGNDSKQLGSNLTEIRQSALHSPTCAGVKRKRISSDFQDDVEHRSHQMTSAVQ